MTVAVFSAVQQGSVTLPARGQCATGAVGGHARRSVVRGLFSGGKACRVNGLRQNLTGTGKGPVGPIWSPLGRPEQNPACKPLQNQHAHDEGHQNTNERWQGNLYAGLTRTKRERAQEGHRFRACRNHLNHRHQVVDRGKAKQGKAAKR